MWTNPRRWLPEPLVDLFDACRFEWKGVVGRCLTPRRLDPRGKEYLNLGSGWGDALPAAFFNVEYYHAGPGPDACVDLRFPLPFHDGTWRGVYTHHVLEHVEYHSALALLSEIHRVLKPGGFLRIAVPDGEKVLRLYASGSEADRKTLTELFIPCGERFTTPIEAVNYQFRSGKFNKHHFCWDYETLALRLSERGFVRIRKAACNDSENPVFQLDRPEWADHSLYVEAWKDSPAA